MVSSFGGVEQVGVRAVVDNVSGYVAGANQVTSATDKINKSVTAAAGSSENYGKALTGLGSQMRTAGTTASLLGTALAAPGVAAVKLALDFNTSITRLSTLSGVAQGDLGTLREGINAISSTSGRGPQELANALLAITSTGLRGAEALDVLNASAKASSLGLGDAETVGRLLTGTLQAYQKTGLTAARATDILFAAVRDGGAEADTVAGSLGRVTGIAATFGVTLEEVGAFIATFTRLGISADEAVTALRGAITAIFAPAEQTKKALKDAGLSAEELQKVVQQQGLEAALELLVTRFQGNSEAISDVIPNVRALAGVLGTAGSQADDYAQNLENAKNSQGDFNAAFAQLQATPGFKVQQAIADLQAALIDLGANGLPALVRVVDVFSNAIGVFTSLPEPVQTAVLAFSVLGGALLTVVGVLGFVGGSILSIVDAFTFLTPAITAATVAAAANPLVLAAVAVAAIGAGAGYLFLKSKIDDASDAQDRNAESAAALKLATEQSTTSIDAQAQTLSDVVLTEQFQVDALEAVKHKSTEVKVKIDELNDSLKEHKKQLDAVTQAQQIATIAQNLSSQQIQGLIDSVNQTVDGYEHEQASIKKTIESHQELGAEHNKNIARYEELNDLIGKSAGTLGLLQSALGISTDREKALADQTANTNTQLSATQVSANNAQNGIFDLGVEAGKSTKDLAGLTVQAAATAATLQLLSLLSSTAATGARDVVGSVKAFVSNASSLLGQAAKAVATAKGIQDQIAGVNTVLTHSIGELTSEEEQAAKSAASAASSAADDAARAAEQAAEDAQRALEQLAQKAAQTAEEAARNAQKIAEDAAAAAVKAAEDAAAAYDRIIKQEIGSLDQLGSLLVTALKRQAQQALDAQLAGIKSERDARVAASKATIDALNKTRDATIDALNDERDAAIENANRAHDRQVEAINDVRDTQLAAIKEQTDARVAALQAQLDVIDQASVAEQRADLQRQLALAFEPEERARVLKEIADFERQQREKGIRDQIAAVQDAGKQQEDSVNVTADRGIEAAKEQADATIAEAKKTADAQIQYAKDSADARIEQEQKALDAANASFDAQEKTARDAFAAITDEWALQSAARVLVMQGEIDTIGKLLDAFVPEWRAAGLSFGEAIKNGLNASNVADFIRATLSGVPDANGVTPAAMDRAAQIAGLEAMGKALLEGGAPQIALDNIAKQITDLGAIPQFDNSTVQAANRDEEIRQRQQQGKDLKAGGAPDIVLEDLRNSLIALGAIPEFARGLAMGVVPRKMLAMLHPGEVVLNPAQQAQMGSSGAVFQAGAFSGLFSGASFSGEPEDIAQQVRRELEVLFESLIGRGAYHAGY